MLRDAAGPVVPAGLTAGVKSMFQLLIVPSMELYPQVCVGWEKEPNMTLPEHVLLKRRLQILDDTTRDERRSDERAIQSEDTSEDALKNMSENTSEDTSSEDSWVKNFMGRLAGLVRHLDHRK